MAECTLCGAPAVVQWARRPTDVELAAHVAAVQEWRDQRALLADAQQPALDFGPLPAESDTTVPVYACADHAIGIDAAALVHTAACTAPPGCDCTPEAPPVEPVPDVPALPGHWQSGSADA